MISLRPDHPFDILLERLFDYAGMFPPASRSFERALAESSRLPESLQRPWILASDLVLDVKHAQLLLSAIRGSLSGFSRPISLVLLASESPAAVCELAEEIVRETASATTPVSVRTIEAKCPRERCATIIALFRSTCVKLHANLAIEPELSVEPWREALLEATQAAATEPGLVALKCRCTGTTGIGAHRLAHAIAAACDARIPFKVTGGFHHPIAEPTRHEYPMGFLNLAAAVSFRRALGTGAPLEFLENLLTNNSADAFSFGPGLAFEDLFVSLDRLKAAREQALFSIGSCSLHEPDDDLRRLFPAQS